MGQAHIGCSGYKYPHWRRGVFYPKNLPQDQEFDYYAQHFHTVEINSTFYRLPNQSVWEKWERRAPAEFIYAIKMNRFLTHRKKLQGPKESWERFIQGVGKLRSHLGPILIQLPPRWHRNEDRLKKLAKILPRSLRIAFEFRDKTWFSPSVYRVLRENNWALVLLSHPHLPLVEEITADFVYLRFHGQKVLYRSSYSREELKEFAVKINSWRNRGLDVYGYFNNDAQGNAPRNALALKELIYSPT